MIIPRVENLIFDKKNSKDEIWMLNYQNISLDHKIIKVFLKHQLKYPKKRILHSKFSRNYYTYKYKFFDFY